MGSSGIVAAAPLDRDSFGVRGFEDQVTEYTATLDDVRVVDGSIEVDVTLTRDGSSAIIQDGELRLFVANEQVDLVQGIGVRSAGTPETLSGPGSPGDSVLVTFESPVWSDSVIGTIELTATVPTLDPVTGTCLGSSSDTTAPGAEATITASVELTNPNDVAVERHLALLVDTSEIGGRSVTVDPGTATFEVSGTMTLPDQPGTSLSVSVDPQPLS